MHGQQNVNKINKYSQCSERQGATFESTLD